MQVLTCFTGTKVLAYWYKSTNTDTSRAAGVNAFSRCSLALLVQKYFLTGTKVQILTPGDAAFIPPPRQNAIFVPLSGGREVFV